MGGFNFNSSIRQEYGYLNFGNIKHKKRRAGDKHFRFDLYLADFVKTHRHFG
jgi:hypothetical protein